MPTICPSILAADKEQYHRQMEKVAGFAERIQIDLTDGKFADPATIEPQDAWWPVGIKVDFHLMYDDPGNAVDTVLQHEPHMIIMHAEAKGNFMAFAERCKSLGIKSGVALLAHTPPDMLLAALDKIDHVLIFSGNLGQFGGHADIGLLEKVNFLKHHKSSLEIGWDGGINEQNISQLASGGVDVFDVGGYIQEAPEPEHAFRILERIAEETGTT